MTFDGYDVLVIGLLRSVHASTMPSAPIEPWVLWRLARSENSYLYVHIIHASSPRPPADSQNLGSPLGARRMPHTHDSILPHSQQYTHSSLVSPPVARRPSLLTLNRTLKAPIADKATTSHADVA